MFIYMKQYLNTVDHDVKIRFKIASVAFVVTLATMTAAILAVVRS
jgi:hypothetical protein